MHDPMPKQMEYQFFSSGVGGLEDNMLLRLVAARRLKRSECMLSTVESGPDMSERVRSCSLKFILVRPHMEVCLKYQCT